MKMSRSGALSPQSSDAGRMKFEFIDSIKVLNPTLVNNSDVSTASSAGHRGHPLDIPRGHARAFLQEMKFVGSLTQIGGTSCNMILGGPEAKTKVRVQLVSTIGQSSLFDVVTR